MTPFRIAFTNFVAVIAQYAILVTFMAALMLETDSVDTFGLGDFALGCILCMVNALTNSTCSGQTPTGC